jgi:RimJ/RimL family protein N-acetyltransferase
MAWRPRCTATGRSGCRLNERLARRMLESLRSWPLLNGFRGRTAADIDRLVEVVMRFSYLVADHPEIQEIDVNPLLVTPDDVMALDARVILDRSRLGEPWQPYRHLVLRPYPEEYVRPAKLRDGTPVLLRPIKPEDEPLWKDMLGRCSADTIFARFRGNVAWGRHDIATRYCFIDYEREIAIVVEHEENGAKQLLGVGRLIADPDHETVEYAVLVADAWQNRGLGGVLTDYCYEIAQHWGLERIVAETHPSNARMLALFRSRGYTLEPDAEGEVVEVVKDCPPGRPASGSCWDRGPASTYFAAAFWTWSRRSGAAARTAVGVVTPGVGPVRTRNSPALRRSSSSVRTNRPSAVKMSIRAGPSSAIENDTWVVGLNGFGWIQVIAVRSLPATGTSVGSDETSALKPLALPWISVNSRRYQCGFVSDSR